MSKEILVPIDGSEHAFKALDLAADLAKLKQASICLMHVAPVQEVPEGLKEWARAEHVTEAPAWVMETGAAQNLLQSARDRLEAQGVESAESLVEHGNVARCIVDYAKLPLEVAWGQATLNPTAVAESKVLYEPVWVKGEPSPFEFATEEE